MESFLVALVWLLIYALGIALICYIVTRLAKQFVPAFEPYAWIVYCIGGLVLLILALRLFSPMLGGLTVAYCTADEVNEILGGSLSPEAEDAAAGVVDGVSGWIDGLTGQSWTGGAVPSEVQTVRNGQITLSRTPVSAITAISVTEPYIGAVPTVLVDGVSYQLIDPSRGLVLLAGCDGAVATASYTAVAVAVPASINLAAKILSAHCIRYAIDPTGWTLSQLQAGTATLTYTGGGGGAGSGSGGGDGNGLPALFESLLGAAKQTWVFA